MEETTIHKRKRLLARVFRIGFAWAAVWLAVMLLIGAAIAILSPGSIDPGEGPRMFVLIFGPMGFFSGVVFAALLLWVDRTTAVASRSFARATICGFAATAVVQGIYLGHGDQGLAANLRLAALFSAIGAVVGITWLALARGWSRWRTSRPARA